MNLIFETEQEDDGRWLADVPELTGVMAYGATGVEAIVRAEALENCVSVEIQPSAHCHQLESELYRRSTLSEIWN